MHNQKQRKDAQQNSFERQIQAYKPVGSYCVLCMK